MNRLIMVSAIVLVIALAAFGYVMTLGGGLVVQNARIVADPRDPRDAKLFMTIANRGGEADRLIGVATDLAWNCGFHSVTAATGGAPYLDLPAESIVTLGPESAHIDLSEIGEPVRAGDEAVLVLGFERAGEMPIKARVAETVTGGEGAHGAALFDPRTAGEPVPTLDLSGSVLEDGRVALTLTVENFTFDRAAVDGAHRAGTGHAHLYIDGEKVGRVYDPTYRTDPLSPGRHEIRVELNTNDHRAYARAGAPIAAVIEVAAP